MSDPVIDIADFFVRAGRRTILSVQRLTVQSGEILAILGRNGAGKTTLLKSLVGFQHGRGEVRILGQSVSGLGTGGLCRLRRRVGYLPQLPAAHSETPLTLREVVAVGRSGLAGLFRPLRREDWRIVDEWIDRLGLGALQRCAYADLSGGEQRKTLLAKAMVQQPEVLLLDEPTANLDLAAREILLEALEQVYGRTRVTVLLVCHELEALPPSCRRVAFLADGAVVAQGSCEEVLTEARVADLYGRAFGVLRRGGRWSVVPPLEEGAK